MDVKEVVGILSPGLIGALSVLSEEDLTEEAASKLVTTAIEIALGFVPEKVVIGGDEVNITPVVAAVMPFLQRAIAELIELAKPQMVRVDGESGVKVSWNVQRVAGAPIKGRGNSDGGSTEG